jgi:hypothetical protein
MSSSVVHLPTRGVVSSLLESKTNCHLFRHCCFVRSGTSSEIETQSSHLRFSTASCSLSSSSVPSMPTLLLRSTRNQRGNKSPIIAIVLLFCIFQRDVFVCCPFTLACDRLVTLGFQGTVPSMPTLLLFLSTRNQRDNRSPILAIVLLYCIFQLAVFFLCLFTLACDRLLALGVQGTVPSTLTLCFRSTRNLLRNSSPIFAIVFFTASVSMACSSVVQLPTCAVVSSLLKAKISCHLALLCCFDRPGTSSEIETQSSPLRFSTASCSLPSSSFVHLLTRTVVSPLLEPNILCHLLLHWCFV